MSQTQPTKEQFAKMIDHTNLDPKATIADIKKLCQEAIDCGFGQVCIRPDMVKTAVDYLKGNGVGVVSVVGFPKNKAEKIVDMENELETLSADDNKRIETRYAVRDGAKEIDMILDLKSFYYKDFNKVFWDILHVVEEARSVPVKVIIETCFLPSQKYLNIACSLAELTAAAYVKTSTGFGPKGAQIEDIERMSFLVNENTGIKASGGIQTLEQAMALYKASQKYKKHPFRIGASKLVSAFKPGATDTLKPGNY